MGKHKSQGLPFPGMGTASSAKGRALIPGLMGMGFQRVPHHLMLDGGGVPAEYALLKG